MGDIKSITIKGSKYNIKDAEARKAIDASKADIDELKNAVGLEIIGDFDTGYYNLSWNNAKLPDKTNDANFYTKIVECAEGDVFKITSSGASSAKNYGFIDSENNIITREDGSTNYNRKDYIVTAPANAHAIVVNLNKNRDYLIVRDNTVKKADIDEIKTEQIEQFKEIAELDTRLSGAITEISKIKSVTKSGRVIVIDNAVGDIEKVENNNASKVLLINKNTSLMKTERHSTTRGLHFSNREGFLYISGVKDSASDASRYWDGGFKTDSAHAKTAFVGNGGTVRIGIVIKSDSIINNAKITLRIFNKNNSSDYKTLIQLSLDGTLRNSVATFETVANVEYTFCILVNSVPIGVDIGCVSMYAGYSFDNDATDIYTEATSIPNKLPYRDTVIMHNATRDISITYKRNSTINTNRYILETLSSYRRACCNLLIDKWNDNAILFDLSDVTANNNVLGVVSPYHIKTVIISHFHYDHIGMDYEGTGLADNGFLGLLKNKLDDGCVFYIQKRPVNVGTALYDSAVSLLERYGLEYLNVPFSGYEVVSSDVSIKFFNIETDEYTADILGGYNNTSLCCNVSFENRKICFTGDIYSYAQERCYSLGYFEKADILVAPHHGLAGKILIPMVKKIDPSAVIINFGTSYDRTINNYLWQRGYSSVITEYCTENNIPVFDVADNNGTFDIRLGDGIDIMFLNNIMFNANIRSFSNSRSAIKEEFDNNQTDEYSSSLTVKTLLCSMPQNSSVDLLCYATYQLFKDLIDGDHNNNEVAFVSAVKTCGGNSNYIFGRSMNRSYESEDFVFKISATLINDDNPLHVEYVGRYKKTGDVFTIIKVN